MGGAAADLRHDALAFLRTPAAYPDHPSHVDVIETHFAWVFLSARLAYKLSKPIRFHEIDFTTLAKRKANCTRAVRLNQRLAESVYIGTVPLTHGRSGFELEGDAKPVEWLVKMNRLPSESMLDRRFGGMIARSELVPLVAKLARFYGRSPAAHWDGERYASELRGGIMQWGEQLSAFPGQISIEEADRLVTAQLGFVARNRALLDERVAHGRVVDGHGDLRPEHVSLTENPQIIDCLEFADHLRLIDAAEEIGGLALECARLGRHDVGRQIVEAYRLEADDAFGDELLAFYESRQALRRAVLCAWHLEDPMYAASERQWIDRTHWYLANGRARLDDELVCA